MKVYSNHITTDDVRKAFHDARTINECDIWLDDIRTFKPQKKMHATYGLEFFATSDNGKIATGHRPIGSYPLDNEPRAASWSDYGYVIARLFNVDPHAKIGWYENEADFVAKVRSHGYARNLPLEFLTVLTNIVEYLED